MSQYENLNSGFQYLLAHNKPLLIVTFIGDMDQSTVQPLNACRKEIADSADTKFVILNFRDVGNINGESISSLTQMQIEIRGRGCDLRISSMKPAIRDKLLKMGVIRSSELANNLREALLSMVNAKTHKKAA